MTRFRLVGEQLVHRGFIWRVTASEFESPDGERFFRDVVRSPGAVGVVPMWVDAEGTPGVILVRQFRPALDEEIVEIPAGMRDVEGEPPETTAHRELVEEIGYAADEMVLLAELFASPGMTDSVIQVFMASGLREVGRHAHGPEERHMEVLHLSLDEALAWVEDGRIRDAKSVAGLLLAARRVR